MDNNKQKIKVKIMGKHYSVVCPHQQEEKLAEAVVFLNEKIEDFKQKMHDIKADTTGSRDSLLAVIALNLSYELLVVNAMISDNASETKRLVERIKNNFVQHNVDDATHKDF